MTFWEKVEFLIIKSTSIWIPNLKFTSWTNSNLGTLSIPPCFGIKIWKRASKCRSQNHVPWIDQNAYGSRHEAKPRGFQTNPRCGQNWRLPRINQQAAIQPQRKVTTYLLLFVKVTKYQNVQRITKAQLVKTPQSEKKSFSVFGLQILFDMYDVRIKFNSVC